MDSKRQDPRGTGFKWQTCLTVLLFVLILSLRLVHIGNAPVEAGDYWRQPDTESIARNFLNYNSNILYPQFNYDGPAPNYAQLEFQVTTAAIAGLYWLFGQHYFLARLVPTAFFMISALYLFLLARKRLNYPAAWLGTFIYGIFPLTLFYSRAIMPESALLCFYVAGLYYFEKWLEEEQLRDILLSALLTMLAITQKPPIAFIGLAMLGLCLLKYGRRIFTQWQLWLFAALSLLPAVLYFRFAGAIAETRFVDKIATQHIFPKALQSLTDATAWQFLAVSGAESFSLVFIALAGLGFIVSLVKRDWLAVFWIAAISLEQLIVNSVIRFVYYMDVAAPILALLAAIALQYLIGGREGETVRWRLVAATILLALWSGRLIIMTEPRYTEMKGIISQAEVINEVAAPGELVLTGSFEPSALSLSERQGWRANLQYYPDIPVGAEAEIDWYRARGAKYMVLIGDEMQNDPDGAYIDYIQGRFSSRNIDGCTVYYLEP